MEEAQRQQVDPDAERRNREIAQLYNDTGLQEPTMEEAQAPQQEEQISMQDAQSPRIDEPSMQDAQAPQPEPEFTGYTEDTAADAFDTPPEAQADPEPDLTPEEKRDGFLETIQDNILNVVDKAGFDPDEYRASQQGAMEQRYARAQEALARRFYLTPGGAMSGDAQIAFENLAASHNQDLAALDADIADRQREAINTQLEQYNQIFQTAATDDRERLKITQNSDQFAKSLELKFKEFGLTEKQTLAAIDKIFNDIKNDDQRTALEVGTTWAEVLGFTGTESGQLGAEDLGIELTDEDIMSAFLPTGGEETKQKIRDQIVAQTGQEPSDAEVQIIMSGQKANFNNIPTLESRRLSQENTQQNMDRTAKYGAIADELGIERDKFAQEVKEYDNKWALSTGDTAALNDIDPNAFTMARYQYDNYANQVFYNKDLTPQERTQLLQDKVTELSLGFGPKAANFIRANTQFEQTIGAEQQAAARRLGISAEQYGQSQRQIARDEHKKDAMWASLMSSAEDKELEGFSYLEPEFELDSPQGIRARKHVNAIGKAINDSIIAGNVDGSGTADQIAQEFMTNSSEDEIDALRNAMMLNTNGTLIFTDEQLLMNLKQMVGSVFPKIDRDYANINGLGNDSSGKPFRLLDLDNTDLKAKFTINGSDAEWATELPADKLNAWMSLMGVGNFQATPERQGVDMLALGGRFLGAGIGGFFGGPAGATIGASVGGSIAG